MTEIIDNVQTCPWTFLYIRGARIKIFHFQFTMAIREINMEDHIIISLKQQLFNTKFNIYSKTYSVTFQNLENIENIFDFLQDALEHLLNRGFEGAKPSDMCSVVISHPALKHHLGDILISYRRRDELEAEVLFIHIEEMATDQFTLDEQMEWTFTKVGK